MMTRIKWKSIFIFLIIIIISLFLFKDLFKKKNFYYNEDVSNYFYPAAGFNFTNIKKMELPLWNPYRYGGHPWLADIQVSFFYFIDYIIIYFFGIYYAHITIIFHYILMAFFMYLFARSLHLDRFSSLTAGIIFTINGFVGETLKAGNLGIIKTITYMPLIFCLLTKLFNLPKIKYVILLSFIIALQFFAGHFQFFYYSSFLEFLYIIFCTIYFTIYFKNKKYFLKLISYLFLILILSLLLISIQLLPTFEFTKYCTRGVGVSYKFATINSISPDKLIEFVFSNFFGSAEKDYIGLFEPNNLGYIGFFPVLLIISYFLFVKKSKNFLNYLSYFLLFISILSIALSMGKYLPLFKIFFSYIFGFNFFRSVNRLLIIYIFNSAVLTGIAFNRIFHSQINQKIKYFIYLIFLLSIILFIISTFTNHYPDFTLNKIKIFYKFLWNNHIRGEGWHKAIIEFAGVDRIYFLSYRLLKYSIFAFVSAALLYIINIYKIKIKKTLLLWTFIFLIFDLSQPYIALLNEALKNKIDIETQRKSIVNFLRTQSDVFRISASAVLPYDVSLLNNFFEINGYGSITSERYNEFMNIVSSKKNELIFYKHVNKQGGIHLCNYYGSHLLNLLNVKYVLPYQNNMPEEQIGTRYKLVYIEKGTNQEVYENKDYLPRFFFVNNFLMINNDDDRIHKLFSDTFDYKTTVILEEEPTLKIEQSKQLEYSINISEYRLNKIRMEIYTNQNSLLFLSENYYPGWKFYIDNRPEKIFIADHTFRAVQVPAGAHKLLFEFKPDSFYRGLYLTGLGLILILILIILKFILVIFERKTSSV